MSRYPVLIMLAAALAAPAAVLAEDTRLLDVIVTSASGRSVFIDKGRAAGVQPGQRVVLLPAGAEAVEGTVQAVATDSARVELAALAALPPPGTPGLVEIPVVPAPPPADDEHATDKTAKPSPIHPPWTRKESARSPEMPLLAPAYGLAPGDRPMRIDGRIFSSLQITGDHGGGRDDNYYIGRLGAWVQATNPFGAGGRFEFAGELDYRDADVSFDGSTEFQPILDVASYTLGGEFYSPYVLQIGRFYPTNLPELGVIDGAAGAVQFDNGVRAGGGFGVYPEPFPDRDWGADLSLHVFADYHSKQPGLVSAIIAYQHTWHDGASDRDLILGRVTARPLEQLWFYCSWWLDIYTSGDVLKGPGVDLTQFWAQTRYAPRTDTSLSLAYSHSTWAETKRQQYQPDIPPSVIAGGRVNRVTLSGWRDLSEDLRLSGDLGIWNDQNGNGVDARAAVDWSDPTRGWPSLHGEVFYVQGSYNDGSGIRLQARQDFGVVSAYVGYELFAYTATGTGETDLVRQFVQLGVAWTTGRMRYSIDGSIYFGDEQGAYSVGVFAEYRF